jgi:hypothetical protein
LCERPVWTNGLGTGEEIYLNLPPVRPFLMFCWPTVHNI